MNESQYHRFGNPSRFRITWAWYYTYKKIPDCNGAPSEKGARCAIRVATLPPAKDAPFGHWRTQTFIAGLRVDELAAPWVLDGPMNRAAFEVYIETQLAPCLQPGDVVIADNLSSHKSASAQTLLKAQENWLLFLPPYSPDLNPIEMAFSKLKAYLRRMKARTFDSLFTSVAETCELFPQQECENFFWAAGYVAD
jgi:transposase